MWLNLGIIAYFLIGIEVLVAVHHEVSLEAHPGNYLEVPLMIILWPLILVIVAIVMACVLLQDRWSRIHTSYSNFRHRRKNLSSREQQFVTYLKNTGWSRIDESYVRSVFGSHAVVSRFKRVHGKRRFR